MSLPDLTRRRLLLALAGAGGAALLPACTARPLYATGGVEAGTASARPDIIVKPATDRVGLEVRNHLVFLLTGGGAEPATATYSFDPSVTSLRRSTVSVQRTTDTEPTSGTVTVTSAYSIIDNRTAQVVAQGRRSMVASFDIPRQEFAAQRALRDAENRAARELAETLRIAIAQELAKLPPS
jgi:LPS-assembly lipoprotein